MAYQQKVTWSKDEWRDVALALLKVRPEYLTDPAPRFDVAQLRTAMQEILPGERHRNIHTGGLAGFRKGFVKAYAVIRATLGNTSAVRSASGNNEVAATDFQPGSQPPAGNEQSEPAECPHPAWSKRINWKKDEFVVLASYLRTRYPCAAYIDSSTAAGLSPADVKEAMSALPIHRRRSIKTVNAKLRAHFVEAFKTAKIEAHRATERAEREAKLTAKAEVHALSEQAKAAAPVNAYEVAFGPIVKPLAALLAQEMLLQLMPQLQTLTLASIAQALPQLAQEAGAGSQAAITQTVEAINKAREAAQPKKKIIGILGPKSDQAQDIARAFPEFDIVCLESNNGNQVLSVFRSATRVIGMTNFMQHTHDGILSKHFGERYTRVSGGVSAIKRQIGLWTHLWSEDQNKVSA